MTETPIYRDAPTGAQAHVLRRMLRRPLAAKVDGGRVVGDVGGEHVSAGTLASLVTKGLVSEAGSTDLVTHYTLTEKGKRWATGERK